MKIVIRYLWIFIIFLHNTNAMFEHCDHAIRISEQNPQTIINSPNYPMKYPSGSSCRYQLIAPVNYGIHLECNTFIDKGGSKCDSEFFYISVNGNRQLKNSEIFCGKGYIQRKASANEITLAYTSSSRFGGGSFQCLAKLTLGCDCGWSMSTKIVGGVEAGIHEFPFMVGLLMNNDLFCGGSIISSRYVLTAAHCIKAKGTIGLQIIVGEHDLRTHAESPYTAIYNIDNVIIHNGYYADPDGDQNDIALLRTLTEIIFSKAVGPICLPFLYQYNWFIGYPVELMGWGLTSFSGRPSTVLLKATVQVQDNNNCRAEFPKLIDSQICTYGHEKDSCQYDSGGPVVFRSSRMFLVGLNSYGKICGLLSPSMSTRITSYLDWIQLNTGETFCKKSYI